MVMKRMNASTPALAQMQRSFSPKRSHGSPKGSLKVLPKKTLSFSEDLCKIKLVECIANEPDTKNAMWYDGKELGGMRKQEIRKVKKAQIVAGEGRSIETDEMTWRGFEDIQGHWCRVQKSHHYTGAVVRHYHNQLEQGYFDADELKKLAKGLSKEERQRARNLALKDMADAGIKMDKKSRMRKSSSNLVEMPKNGSGHSPKSNLRKTMSMAGVANLRKTGSSGMLKLTKTLGLGGTGNFQWNRNKKDNAAHNSAAASAARAVLAS